MSTAAVTGVGVHRRTDLVDVVDLRCPGCAGPVAAQPPSGWPRGAGVVPEFSHPDGSVLCPDGRGRIGEPVEVAAGVRS